MVVKRDYCVSEKQKIGCDIHNLFIEDGFHSSEEESVSKTLIG